MYKIRVDAVGFDSYTGPLGPVNFTNGVSDREVSHEEAARLGAIIKIVRVDTDVQVGAGMNIAEAMKTAEAKVVKPLKVEKEEKPVEEEKTRYTREFLEEVAETKGMKGIRTIADEFGVKGVQIAGLIDEILEAQEA